MKDYCIKDIKKDSWFVFEILHQLLSSLSVKLHAFFAEFLLCLLNLTEKLMIGLIAVTEGEQVPSDVDEGAAAEHDDGVEGEGKDQEEAAVVGVTQ